ncbi:molecular chaperone [Bacillus sp. FJAT-18017]|nr:MULTISPECIES: BA3454 family stress response protein [unclassified Bacillus (in: firmicutes)]ALC90429.1 molecular chaperone [Bacillus sp. FJAT-18017]
MVQVNVKVEYLGRNYLTNVIANPHASEEEIMQLALEQVKKQWGL